MTVELEPQDLQAIAEKVVEMLKPHLQAASAQDDNLDKKGLAEYLKVDISWIEKQITARAIPYFKLGKYTRFKKSRIDQWNESRMVEPIPDLKHYRRGR